MRARVRARSQSARTLINASSQLANEKDARCRRRQSSSIIARTAAVRNLIKESSSSCARSARGQQPFVLRCRCRSRRRRRRSWHSTEHAHVWQPTTDMGVRASLAVASGSAAAAAASAGCWLTGWLQIIQAASCLRVLRAGYVTSLSSPLLCRCSLICLPAIVRLTTHTQTDWLCRRRRRSC